MCLCTPEKRTPWCDNCIPDDIKELVKLNRKVDLSMSALRKWFLEESDRFEANLDAVSFIKTVAIYKAGINKIALWRETKKAKIEAKLKN